MQVFSLSATSNASSASSSFAVHPALWYPISSNILFKMAVRHLLASTFRRKKSIPPSHDTPSLADSEKPLKLPDLVLFGVGGTLGSGLFILAGNAARYVAGPAVSLSFVFAAIASLFTAFSYAEMASRLPNNGGAYSFTYDQLGELPAFLVGMCLTLEYGISSAAIARSWASYLADSIPIFPPWASGINSQFSLLAALLILSLTFMLSMGMKEAKWAINITTLIYLFLVLTIIAFGAPHVNKQNWSPYFPFGLEGVIAASSAVFFAYIGFDEVASVAEEAQNAATTIPLSIFITLFIVTVLYISAATVLTGITNYSQLQVSAPFSAAFRAIDMPVIAHVVAVGTSLGMMNTCTVSLAAQPRIFTSMGRDGLLPPVLAVSTKRTTLICGFFVALMALVFETQILADVISGGTLLAFMASNISLLLTRCRIHSRSTRTPILIYAFAVACAITGILVRLVMAGSLPTWFGHTLSFSCLIIPLVMLQASTFEGGASVEHFSPAFLCPLVPWLPLFGLFTTAFLICQLPIQALSALCTWLVMSTTTYFCYGIRNSCVAHDVLDINSADGSHRYDAVAGLAMEANSVCSESPTSQIRTVPES